MTPPSATHGASDNLGPAAPTPPLALAGGNGYSTRWAGERVVVPDSVVAALSAVCDGGVTTSEADLAEASRDWWPLAMTWASDGGVGGLASVVVRPRTTGEVAAVLAVCNDASVPVTAAGGRSGVCGASVPVFGGVILDTCGLAGIRSVDLDSMVLDVGPGTFGDHLEDELARTWGVTVGHWPQSMALSTVGGWLACRGAGQLSNRYGKIEDMVVGLDVVLANGTVIHTGGHARAAVGPDLNQLFVGSEGTLGIITGARLRLHRLPATDARSAWGFPTFAAGLEACREAMARGARPAVSRLYDAFEANGRYHTGDQAVLLILDEGDPTLVGATMALCAEAARDAGGTELSGDLVGEWLGHRNDVAALEALISKGYVVDTMEVTGAWGSLGDLYAQVTAAISGVEGTVSASAHQSHAYPDGACLYFTFAGKVDAPARDTYYRAVWDAATGAALAAGASLSHHHGIGINRARFVGDALGSAAGVLASLKDALDPNGILNPGKLGLPSPFGTPPFAEPGSADPHQQR